MADQTLDIRTEELSGSQDFISVYYGGSHVFSAISGLVLGEQNYAVFWQVSPEKDRAFYLSRLANFYLDLRKGNFEDDGSPSIAAITYSDNKLADIPLEQVIEGNAEALIGFKVLDVITPYAQFSMIKDGKGEWTPRDGRIQVVTHLNLSEPVAKLIAETAKYSVPIEKLQSVLFRKIYRS